MRFLTFASTAAFATAVSTHAQVPPPLSLDPFAVTSVRMIEAPSRAQALHQCELASAGAASVGIDWGTGANNGRVHLCQVRTSIKAIQRAVALQGATPAMDVLQQIAVFADASCPTGMTLLASPRNNVVVCVLFTSSPLAANDAISAGHYINDLAVTSERNYNNDGDMPSWTTLPVSLHTTGGSNSPANRGVFLSMRRPVHGITALRELTNVAPPQVARACSKALGPTWRAAGTTLGVLDQADTSGNKTVLCVQRQVASQAKLVEIKVINTTTTTAACDGQLGFDPEPLPLSSSFALCTKYLSTNAAPFLVDLDLHTASAALGEDASNPSALQFLPGGFSLVAASNLNQASNTSGTNPVYLFARKWQPRAQVPIPTLPVAKPPLVAKVSTAGLSFKILQVADLHYTGDATYACRNAPAGVALCTEALMTSFVNDLLDAEKPDFVAFTGDNIETFSAGRRAQAMQAVVAGVEARGIPYGMVFGNHDDENGFSREEIVQIAASKPFSYTQRGPVEIDGVGNYELDVHAPVDGVWGAKGTDVFRMYFLDSHGYPDKKKYPLVSSSYDWVKPNQIEFYKALSVGHAASQNSVPAVMFFHIPLVEYAANAQDKTNGEQFETVASSDVSTNLFSALVDRGEVKATFCGHDHVNDYCYNREGIQLCYGGGVGFGRAYGGATFARRARVVEWSVGGDGKRTIRSWKRHFGDVLTRRNEQVLYAE